MSWFVLVVLLPFIITGGYILGKLLGRVIARSWGRRGGELHVDCPRCWRRILVTYGNEEPEKPLPDAVPLTCHCGTNVYMQMVWGHPDGEIKVPQIRPRVRELGSHPSEGF
jgi:hypothetical protein